MRVVNARVHSMHVLDLVTPDAFTSGAAKTLCVSKSHACTCEHIAAAEEEAEEEAEDLV